MVNQTMRRFRRAFPFLETRPGGPKALSSRTADLKSAWVAGFLGAALACAPFAAGAATGYSVAFEGAPAELASELKAIPALSRSERVYPTITAISVIARRDVRALENALRAGGYYAGKASARIEQDEAGGEPRVVFAIIPGPRFRISDYRIVYEDDREDGRPRSLAEAGIAVSGAADGAALEKTQQQMLRALWEQSFPAARIVGRRAEADIEAGTAVAVFVFESGPRARFGDLVIRGDIATETRHLEKLKTWEAGEPYERSKLVAYRDRLSKTGLFRTVDVTPGAPDETGAAPVIVSLEERKRRTIGGGLSYSTAEGPGGRLFFEYRNLFHRGERSRIELAGSALEQSLALNFDKPLPAFPGSAFAAFKLQNETTDAFDARTIAVSGGVARQWFDDRFETRGGLALETSKVETDLTEERNYFVSAPMSATWNSEDNLLNPAKGVRATWSVTPYTGTDSFTLSELTARTRFIFGPDERLTAAFRGRLGATFGSSLVDLPSNKRYFSGGGGSIRGYDFQAVGPLNPEGQPIGGRSVVEAAFEARVRVSRNIQIAGFADAGSVGSENLPDFGGDYFVGAGAGVRYLTPIGPIRFDVATPLERRPSDRRFQFYISLGQPF
jgi:translocation and assembly module TamA